LEISFFGALALRSIRGGQTIATHFIAQARLENMTLLTADRTFSKYEVQTMFCGM
jgi:hypothetical protein